MTPKKVADMRTFGDVIKVSKYKLWSFKFKNTVYEIHKYFADPLETIQGQYLTKKQSKRHISMEN